MIHGKMKIVKSSKKMKKQIKEEAPYQINKDIEKKFKKNYLNTIKNIHVDILKKVKQMV